MDVIMLKSTTSSLDTINRTTALQETTTDSNALNPDTWLNDTNYIGNLNSWLCTLSQEHCNVLQHRFGLNGHELYSLDQTGEAIGITRERTKQVQGEALQMLRDLVNSNELD
jgi:RNA polymerase nonessential primary-like sigma factor